MASREFKFTIQQIAISQFIGACLAAWLLGDTWAHTIGIFIAIWVLMPPYVRFT